MVDDTVEHQKWQTVRPSSADSPCAPRSEQFERLSYLVRDYPSNHVRSVGYRLGTGPDLLRYKYKGVRAD